MCLLDKLSYFKFWTLKVALHPSAQPGPAHCFFSARPGLAVWLNQFSRAGPDRPEGCRPVHTSVTWSCDSDFWSWITVTLYITCHIINPLSILMTIHCRLSRPNLTTIDMMSCSCRPNTFYVFWPKTKRNPKIKVHFQPETKMKTHFK